ncbi:1-(5-phosphoribosyl)-5-[(5-phosphoribosylamino)methylideneamino]imidazole-4-carboxamide isomerase [Rurimicrobium arvi]|uniref:1-(5-phosphoribosyl)-5-[(5-phosphoribosylamino)methylideneamino] imidazole-4-carboxamide isomerase n=1 Tax=Rurimicrobium arvi TaxID=2049916 RepID=A0ABP8N1Q6_9BACT
MIIIPAIDLMDGRCVRLSQGDFSRQSVYRQSPLEQALLFESAGIQHLHLVDLDGARAGEVQQWNVLEQIASRTSLCIDFSGGIRDALQVRRALDSGAQKVVLGSLALRAPETFLDLLEQFGPERIVLGADAKDGLLATLGWQEQSAVPLVPFLQHWYTRGVRQVLCTDISRDGMLEGPAFELYRGISESVPVQLIASGGVGAIADLKRLQADGCYAAVIGKALYEGTISLSQLSDLC